MKVYKCCALHVDALVIRKNLVRPWSGPEPVVENQRNSSSKTNSSPKEASTNETSQEDGKAYANDVYGDWMVVKRKTRPYGKGTNLRKGYGKECVENKDDGDDRRGIHYTPRDSKSDQRKDVKRKAAKKDTLEGSYAKPDQSQQNQTNARNYRSEVSYEHSGV